MVKQDVEGLDGGLLVSISGGRGSRLQMVDKVPNGKGVGEKQANCVRGGVRARFVVLFASVEDPDSNLLLAKLLPGDQCRLEVGYDDVLEWRQLWRSKELTDDLFELPTHHPRRDGHIVSVEREIGPGGQLDVVSPDDDFFADGAMAGSERERLVDAKLPELRAELLGLRLDSILSLSNCGGRLNI